jgi:hypothetical protein
VTFWYITECDLPITICCHFQIAGSMDLASNKDILWFWFSEGTFKQNGNNIYIQNHQASGLCPSSRILNARKQRFINRSVTVLRWGEGVTYPVCSLRKR